jgi:uncharacterized protein YjbI with pentapeptide repeats
MAVAEHLDRLRLGTPGWNRWRQENPTIIPDFSGAHLEHVRLSIANLADANFESAYIGDADMSGANLTGANLRQAYLRGARLSGVVLDSATLTETELGGADLCRGRLVGANLTSARLRLADLSDASLEGARLCGADLRQVVAVGTNFRHADLSGCHVYGISAWNIDLHGATQHDLVITPDGDGVITADNLAVAQLLFLLLHNENLRDVIETVAKKAVLVLGRFTSERKIVLEAIRDGLRRDDWVPILFDFAGPRNRDRTETISTLAHLARGIIVDLTDARSVPQELMAIVPSLPSVPVQPILADSDSEYATFEHLARYAWVAGVFRYSSPEELTTWLAMNFLRPDGDV